MIISMFLAHLIGDYILQWDSLAAWKGRELKGVLAHGMIVTIVTFLFILPFEPLWIEGALFICTAHILIDTSQLYIKPPIAPLLRFGLDQLAHFTVIIIALVWGGYVEVGNLTGQLTAVLQNDRVWIILLGYAFITMPVWVIIKFLAYGLVKGAPPDFGGTNKYVGIMERLLIATFVAMGQFLLVPLVTLPRLVAEWPSVKKGETAVYLTELLASIYMAVIIGLLLTII